MFVTQHKSPSLKYVPDDEFIIVLSEFGVDQYLLMHNDVLQLEIKSKNTCAIGESQLDV